MGSAQALGANTVALFVVPPSLCNVTFWNTSATTVWLGTSVNVNTTNGLTCHSIPTSFTTYVGSKGATIYGANTAASTVSVQYIISTDF